MKIYLNLEAPYEWARVSAKTVTAFGEVPSPADYPIDDEDEVIGVVPGEWVTGHQVNLPAKTRKQFMTALPYSLEEAISEDVENMHFVCLNWKAGEDANVLVVAKQKMLEWKKVAIDNRLPIKQLLPDYALLPFHDAADCSVAISEQGLLTNNRNGSGVSIDPDFLDAWLMNTDTSDIIAVNDEPLTEKLIAEHPERDFRFWAFGGKLSHWLEYPQSSNIELWTDTYRPRVNRRGNKIYLIPLLLIVLSITLKLAYDSYRYFAMHAEIAAIETEAQGILKQRFPVFKTVAGGTERELMEKGIARMGGPDRSKSVHNTLAQASAILSRQGVTLSDIIYRDEELILTCLLNDFSQVDLLSKQLNRRPGLAASLQSSASEDGKIVASYSIKNN